MSDLLTPEPEAKTSGFRIIQLTAESFKRLHAVSITPSGNVVQITGRNGAGKSSVIDAIWATLGGGAAQPDQPIRRGEKKAQVKIDLGEYVVTRQWTKASTYLTITAANGSTITSPQKLLDKMVGQLTFDPLAFTRMKPREQAEALRRIVKLDFSTIDKSRAAAFDQRTAVNRDVARCEAEVKGIPFPAADTPDAEVSPAELTAQIAEITAKNEAADAAKRAHENAREARMRAELALASHRDNQDRIIAEEDAAMAAMKARHNKLRAERNTAIDREADAVVKAKDIEAGLAEMAVSAERADPQAIQQKLDAVAAMNIKVRQKLTRTAKAAALKAAEKKAAAFTAEIERLDREKEKLLASAKMPVAGLEFTDDGVLLNGLPFTQASGAEQLRVSFAMGMADNPALRIMSTRDGNVLDSQGMKLLAELADEHDMQVWIERVTDGEKIGVVIEDGHVAEQAENEVAHAS